METKRRENLLKVAVAAVVGLFLLDRAVIGPISAGWKEQSARIAVLKEKVTRGRTLVDRQKSIRGRWAEMQQTDLPENASEAENEVFKAISRWTRDSRISLASLTPQWKTNDNGYDLFECRASANGTQASIGQFIFELESDALPGRLDECEITTKDAKGQQLSATLRFTFVRLNTAKKGARQ
jgi:hypothetical protein